MKKTILLFIILLFLFTATVSALTVDVVTDPVGLEEAELDSIIPVGADATGSNLWRLYLYKVEPDSDDLIQITYKNCNGASRCLLPYQEVTVDKLGRYDFVAIIYDANFANIDNSQQVNVVESLNNAPIANNVNVATNEDTSKEVTLICSDADNDALSYIKVTDPAHGSLSDITGNKITYTPASNYNGADSFTYKCSDGTVDSNTATVSITVNAVNDAPVANNVNVVADEDTAKEITLSCSDIDVGDSLTYIKVTDPTNGILSTITNNKIIYTPNLNYNGGADSFTYKCNDGTVDSNTATVSIAVNPVNDAPTANAVSVTTDEDTPKEITLSCADIDGDTLTYIKVTDPAHGSLSAITGNIITYTPNANYNGADSFTYKCNDATVDGNTATVSINVNAINDAPTITSTAITTASEDSLYQYDVEAADSDGDTLTYSLTVFPTGMTIDSSTGLIQWTPTNDDVGDHSVTVEVSDSGTPSLSATQSFTLTVANVNDAPTANDVADTTDEDTAKEITLSCSDIDVGDSLTYIKVTDPTNGILSTITNNKIIYTPNLNYNGDDSFTYKCSDGTVDSNDATITITVGAVNDAPTADFTYTPAEPQVHEEITFTSTSTDIEGDALTYSWDFNNDGIEDANTETAAYTYTAPGDYQVTLTATDTGGLSDDETKTITVTGIINIEGITCFDKVIVGDNQYCSVEVKANDVIVQDALVNIKFSDDSNFGSCTTDISGKCGVTKLMDTEGIYTVYATASKEGYTQDTDNLPTYTFEVWKKRYDITDLKIYDDNTFSTEKYDFLRSETMFVKFRAQEINTLEYVSDLVSRATLVSPDGGGFADLDEYQDLDDEWYYYYLTIPPAHDFVGDSQVFTFVFNLIDESGGQKEVTLTIRNNPPQITPVIDTILTDEDTSKTVDLSLHESDVEDSGDALTWSVVNNNQELYTALINGKILTITPIDNGDGTIELALTDLDGDSALQTVSVTITYLNHVPSITSTAITTASEDSLYQYDVEAADSDGDTLTYSLTVFPTGMTIDSSTGLIQWTPTNDDVGDHSVTVEVSDSGTPSLSATQSFTLTVANVNDAPTANDVADTTDEDTAKEITLSCSDIDVGDSLTYIKVTDPTNGILSTITNNKIIYTPNLNYNGDDSFTYKCSDGTVDSNDATITITVGAVNDAPVAYSFEQIVNEDTAKEIKLSCTDADNDPLTYIKVSDPTNGILSTITNNKIIYTPNLNYNGDDSFTYKCNDGTVDSNDATITITVGAVNDAPTINSIPDQEAIEEIEFTYTLTAEDIDAGDVLTYRLLKSPAGMVINPSSGLISSWTPKYEDVGKIFNIIAKVTDSEGLTDQISFNIKVKANPLLEKRREERAKRDIIVQKIETSNVGELMPGEPLPIRITLTNEKSTNVKDVKLTATLLGLDQRRSTGQFPIRHDSSVTKQLVLDTYDAIPGEEYLLKITISSEGKKLRDVYRPIILME